MDSDRNRLTAPPQVTLETHVTQSYKSSFAISAGGQQQWVSLLSSLELFRVCAAVGRVAQSGSGPGDCRTLVGSATTGVLTTTIDDGIVPWTIRPPPGLWPAGFCWSLGHWRLQIPIAPRNPASLSRSRPAFGGGQRRLYIALSGKSNLEFWTHHALRLINGYTNMRRNLHDEPGHDHIRPKHQSGSSIDSPVETRAHA